MLDADAERSLAFDEARKEVMNLVSVREPFLLIACTHRIVTSGIQLSVYHW